ncbi:RibD family protein [bacterium]|nr:RibD family protein [bacterium]
MRVFSNLASSLDGKIALAKKPSLPLGTAFDRQMMQRLRLKSEAIVFGAETLRVMKTTARLRKAAGREQPFNVVLTRSGKLPANMPFWKDADVKRFIFTTGQGYLEAIKSSKGRAFVEIAGKTGVNPVLVLSHLKSLGVKNVLVEGGGKIMWEFLAAQCLHEINLTLTPKILGGASNPLLVDGPEFKKLRQLTLLKAKKVKNELYLNYKVQGALRF